MPAFRLALLLLCLPGVSVAAGRADLPAAGSLQLFRDRCLKCHSGKRARGDLSLTSRANLLAGGVTGPAIKPGNAEASLLFQHVWDKKMPPRAPLAAAEIELLRKWIDDGAKWVGPDLRPPAPTLSGRAGLDWWSLQPIRRPALPVVKDRARVRTPIDAFLLAVLEAKGLTFSPEADRRTLIRRVTFDLLGLPPAPDEVEAFINDTRIDAYERVVNRLLASPRYGERWARHWLDVVRFAESHGYEMNTLRSNAWPYRDYVIRALNDDIPYRQFMKEQLTGDLVAKDDPTKDRRAERDNSEAERDTQAATGFLVGGPHDMVGNATVEGKLQIRSDDLFDMVAVTSTTFLGLTVGCARCHDHKFDPITQKDFYSLKAIFAGVDHAERDITVMAPRQRAQAAELRQKIAKLNRELDELEPLANTKEKRKGVVSLRNVERFEPVKAKSLRFVVSATIDGSEPCIDELEVYGPGQADNLALANRGVKTSASSVYPNNPLHRLEHLNDGKVGNSRSWISAERGKGWVRLDLPNEAIIDRVVWGRDREDRYRDRLAKVYQIDVSRDGSNWTLVAGSSDRLPPGMGIKATPQLKRLRQESAALADQLREITGTRRIYAGNFRSPEPVHLLNRGDVLQKLDVVGPGVVKAVRPALTIPFAATDAQRRQALADWISHEDNPLAARVMVNRLWHWHFGQGLVRTPSDFGYNGDRPSHPALLDWLAAEFRGIDLARAGRMKHLHRLLVLSSAYRQSSKREASASLIDADNRLLWRGPSRRLEAEAIRDAMLHVSGTLDLSMGGPGYHLWDYSGYVIVFKQKAKLGPEAFRRMIYQFKPRLQQDRTFGAFDCPDATATTPKRNVSTTPLQALNLLNDPFVLDQAKRFADRVVREAGSSHAAQVERAFVLALARTPSKGEATAAEKLVRDHGLPLLCRVLFNANEFVFVH